MPSRRMLWRLFPTYLAITLLSIIAVSWYAAQAVHTYYLNWAETDLEVRAHLIEPLLLTYLTEPDSLSSKPIDSLCKTLGDRINTRITVVRTNGEVLGDSHKDPASMERHDTRPELATALSGQTGMATRYSNTLQQTLMYVAVPIINNDSIIGIVRTSVPITEINESIRSARLKIAGVGFIILVLVALISLWVSRSISRPLEELKTGADRFSQGDLHHRLPVFNTIEIGSLAVTMNKMAEELGNRIDWLDRQRNEQEAILASMREGVIAIDSSENILKINCTAAELLGIDFNSATGRNIHELIRNSEMIKLINAINVSDQPVEGRIVLNGNNERQLQLRGMRLRDVSGAEIGALIILYDVTRLTKLENLRRDFVANVSHELRTPITSIKGFVETLLHEPAENPEDTKRFLAIIARQADRLNAIVEDLLCLSRIEQETESGEITLTQGLVREVLEAAIQACQIQANAKAIRLELTCDNNITAMIDAPLLEQAVINLVGNAIKYSDEGSVVEITVEVNRTEILIHVRDRGCGIPENHHSRLFERFYRVDKARSRELGGTGLGLAIVKHIVLAHGGTVSVESTVGEGSIFTIHIPLPNERKLSTRDG